MEYIRKQFYTLKERVLEPRKFMQVLAGPRQVGKSTLVDQVLAQVTSPIPLRWQMRWTRKTVTGYIAYGRLPAPQ